MDRFGVQYYQLQMRTMKKYATSAFESILQSTVLLSHYTNIVCPAAKEIDGSSHLEDSS